MDLKIHTFDLPLKHEFTISRESRTVQETVIVELADGGHSGFGEATTNPYYNVTVSTMSSALERVRPLLGGDLEDPSDLWGQLAPHLEENPFALCALDQAAWDLWGKKKCKPVYQLWGLDPADAPLSNFTIGIDQVDVMVAKLLEVPDWPIYKIKLGTSADLEIIRELRRHTKAPFRVDANCGWNVEETLGNAPELEELGVEFIEQPLPAEDWQGNQRLFEESPLPIIADESCIAEKDVSGCHGKFHGINIKLVKCGGLTPALRMINQARSLGMKTMVGCMTESTVGISAIAQLAPLLDYVDMDGAALLARDIATGVVVDRGKCIFPAVAGNGVTLAP
jgi:L-alanine-DL-glutamate epimerase-like enolase superfamily enzyme